MAMRRDSNVLALWFLHGNAVAPPACDRNFNSVEPYRDGYVLVIRLPNFVEVKWVAVAPNWSALQVAMAKLEEFAGPFRLKYFLAGWFEEIIAGAAEARERISEITAKSDIRLWTRAFVKLADPAAAAVPRVLGEIWRRGTVRQDYTVECVFDDRWGEFHVERIGPRSLIARLWGQTPASFPCINGGSYDKIVSAAYVDVIAKGEPRYDHVYASVRTLDSMPFWLPYQRIIFPSKTTAGRPSVTVVSEAAPVDIKVV